MRAGFMPRPSPAAAPGPEQMMGTLHSVLFLHHGANLAQFGYEGLDLLQVREGVGRATLL